MTKERTIAILLRIPKGPNILAAAMAYPVITDEGKQVVHERVRRWEKKYRYKERLGIDVKCLFRMDCSSEAERSADNREDGISEFPSPI